MVKLAAFRTGPVDYLALGDSYTIGEGVADDECWPVQLAAALRGQGVAIAHPHILAHTGWSIRELSAAIDQELAQEQLQPRYGLVSLMIGVNDQYRGCSVIEFVVPFFRLLERAIGFAGGDCSRVLVISMPDWGRTPFARASARDCVQISREIDACNNVAAAICRQHGTVWVDITDLTREPALATELVADGLHPSAQMYSLWVERIRDKIRA